MGFKSGCLGGGADKGGDGVGRGDFDKTVEDRAANIAGCSDSGGVRRPKKKRKYRDS